jgi:hypothetical protein
MRTKYCLGNVFQSDHFKQEIKWQDNIKMDLHEIHCKFLEWMK